LSHWPSWYSFGTDPTENTASHNSSIVAWHHYRCGPQRTSFSSVLNIGYVVWRDIFHCCITVYCAIT
jgi:hypothetical protein